MQQNRPFCITIANEKGGTGKSTIAVHLAVALAMQGIKTSVFDLDVRQRSSSRYLENRKSSMNNLHIELAMPDSISLPNTDTETFDSITKSLYHNTECIIFDSPGRDDNLTRKSILLCNLLISPLNDSFVDVDIFGKVNPLTYDVEAPSLYSQMVGEMRKYRAQMDGTRMDWVVLRNRLGQYQTRNAQRVENALTQLAPKAGFRVTTGLEERLIYREMFLTGLTLMDVDAIQNAGVSHLAARQEFNKFVDSLNIPMLETKKLDEQALFIH
jgi:chromosome partitioning protein